MIVLIAETEIAFCLGESERHTINDVTRNNRASTLIVEMVGRSSPPCGPLTAGATQPRPKPFAISVSIRAIARP